MLSSTPPRSLPNRAAVNYDISTCWSTRVSHLLSYNEQADGIDGSLAREHVRDQYFDKSWDKFNDAVESRRPKSADDLPKQAGFYWLLPDIIVCIPCQPHTISAD
jgi:xylulokinase